MTDGEFGEGDWFQVLIVACCYVVIQKDERALSMWLIVMCMSFGGWLLGLLIFLVLRGSDFPEFDIVHSLERSVDICHYFSDFDRSLVDRMKKQGVFLLQCELKLFLDTGRRALPLVVAVLVLAAEINQVGVQLEDLAKEVHAIVSTCRTRYRELLETLVNVAQLLPWGKDITKKNIWCVFCDSIYGEEVYVEAC